MGLIRDAHGLRQVPSIHLTICSSIEVNVRKKLKYPQGQIAPILLRFTEFSEADSLIWLHCIID